MNKPTKFTATFTNGHVTTRGSVKPYTHAWMVVYMDDDKRNIETGFSVSHDGACKGALGFERQLIKANKLYGGKFSHVQTEVSEAAK